MIQYLQRLKHKKGFTLVELAVVVGIIAVLTAIIMVNMLGGDTEKILAANSNAKVFFTASQLTLTRIELTERSIVDYQSGDTAFIEYKNGANTLNGKYLFMEAKFSENGIVWLHVDNYLNKLMTRPESGTMDPLEKYISTNINEYVSESADGYFYALCDENFTVTFAHYFKDRLPMFYGDTLSEFRDKYMIGTGVKLPGMGSIIGTCSDVYTIGSPAAGDYAFGIPVASDANFSKYLSN